MKNLLGLTGTETEIKILSQQYTPINCSKLLSIIITAGYLTYDWKYGSYF